MEHYHQRYCEENINRCKAVTIVLKRIETNSNKPDSSGTKNKRTRKRVKSIMEMYGLIGNFTGST